MQAICRYLQTLAQKAFHANVLHGAFEFYAS